MVPQVVMTPQEMRDWRVAAELTQEEAGAVLGVSGRAVAKWEAGEAPIDERTRLATMMHLRIRRSVHGNHGKPLLYLAHVYELWTDDTARERYLVIARNADEVARLVSQQVAGPAWQRITAEAVSDAPSGSELRVLTSVTDLARKKRRYLL